MLQLLNLMRKFRMINLAMGISLSAVDVSVMVLFMLA
jgi:hypothetical protein